MPEDLASRAHINLFNKDLDFVLADGHKSLMSKGGNCFTLTIPINN